MAQNDKKTNKDKVAIKPDAIQLRSTIKLFDPPIRPIKPQKFIETSELSERLRQQPPESAGS